MTLFCVKTLAIILISCLGIIVYSNTFYAPFHFDDTVFITSNFAIRNIHEPLNIWQCFPCRFVTLFSFAINYHFYKLNVFGYHLFNLMVHLCSAILVWWFVLLTLSTPAMKENKITRYANLMALLAGLVFVSHPVQTEAVTYIWQRTACLATLFYLASISCYVKFRLLQEEGASSSLWKNYYIGALILALLAMFTKEIAITLPLMILLYEFSFLNVKRSFHWQYLVPFLLTIFIIPLTLVLTKARISHVIQGISQGPGGVSPMHYFLTQFRVMATYIRLAFLPLHQNLDYDYPVFKNIFEIPVLTSLVFLATILFFAKRLFSKYRLVSFSIVWFFLSLLPESSFFPQQDIIFEHRLYLPLVGYSLFLVSGLYYLLGHNTIKGMVLVLTMVIICNSVLTFQRNKVWGDDIVLWNDAVGKSPHKARPYVNRGMAYLRQNEFTKAMADLNKAIAMNPQAADSYYNRGFIYDVRGNTTQALADYNKAIEINPNYAAAYQNRSNIYAIQGDFTRAVSDLNKAIELKPNTADLYNNIGTIYAQQGEFIQALSAYNKAIEINPDYTDVYKNRIDVYRALVHNR